MKRTTIYHSFSGCRIPAHWDFIYEAWLPGVPQHCTNCFPADLAWAGGGAPDQKFRLWRKHQLH